jgi:hypothetical protein
MDGSLILYVDRKMCAKRLDPLVQNTFSYEAELSLYFRLSFASGREKILSLKR